ncbi:uncharacterized protein LOC132977298 [Labrus mixtus]|uniref:uncharacterized protein LOC132977298 n=1 Tax=Labrus mixtus TaxID=508554 RepID=UPI0029BFE992|nr:uncharacterized protein LOC132977298 [Labrus mixtus]
MFFDFSSAFNTIQPVLLREKLELMQVDTTTTSWIMDYLTDRPQFVRLGRSVSERAVSGIGAPQGTVLSPFLFTLYTSDFQYNSEACHLQKFSDDTAVVGCISGGEETEYRMLVDNFVAWSGKNHLVLNETKTKEMVVDFRRDRPELSTISILGDEVQDRKHHTEAVYKKGQSRLYFLRKLRSFNVCSKMLSMFYQTVVASAIFFHQGL